MRKTLLLILLSLFCLNAWAQSDDWWIGKPIEDIRFNGLLSVSEYDLVGITDEYIGQKFSDTLSWELQSKIFALDYFESYSLEAVEGSSGTDTVVIEFTVTERPLVDDIIIKGNKNLRDSEILNTVLLKRDDMVTRNKVRLDAEAIKTLYIEKGYPEVEVSGSFEKTEEPGRAIVYFEVTEGAQTRIRNIYFSGNSFVSSNTLRKKLETKEQGLFSSGIFQESTIEADKRTILSYYWERGYVDAKIAEVSQEPTPGETDGKRNYIDITFYVNEGKQYTYGGMTFEGNTLFSDETLSGLIRLEPGAVLNKTALEADFARVANTYFDDGYIFNQIDRKEQRNEQDRTISYVVQIVERGRAHIENIIVKGNTKTRDYVIEREIPLEVGDVFSREKIVQGLQNLYNTQYFSAVNPETPQGSVDNLMDLVVNVEEGKTIDLNFGISFTGGITGFPMTGFLNLADKNFMGKGQEVSVGAEVSTASQTLTLAFKENWLFGHRWYGGVNLSIEHLLVDGVYQDLIGPNGVGVPDPYDGHYVDSDGNPVNPTDEEIANGTYQTDYEWAVDNGEDVDSSYLMDYDSYEVSLGVSTGYTWNTWFGRIGAGTGITHSQNYIWYDEDVYRPYSEDVRDNFDTWLPITKWWTSLSYDTRDLTYNPSKGVYVSQRLTFTGGILPSSRQYIRSATSGDAYFTLLDVILGKNFNLKTVLGLHTELAFILPQISGQLAATDSDLLYIDGMTVALGWPRILGGQSRWDSRINLTLPIFEQFLWFDNYLSATVMYLRDETDPKQGLRDFNDMQLEDFKFSMGSGLKLTIPGIPLGFYFAKRFKILDDGIEWQQGALFQDPDDDTSGLDFVIAFTMTL